MELAEGRTLADELASRGAIPVAESLDLARKRADAEYESGLTDGRGCRSRFPPASSCWHSLPLRS